MYALFLAHTPTQNLRWGFVEKGTYGTLLIRFLRSHRLSQRETSFLLTDAQGSALLAEGAGVGVGREHPVEII